MVKESSVYENLVKEASGIYKKFDGPSEHDGIYLFFSFDLVNSTKFKYRYKRKWPIVFDQFYSHITQEMIEKVKGSVVWKYIGDEVLFYKKVTCEEDLFIHLSEVLNITRNVMKKINISVNETLGNLFIKTSVWIADAKFIQFSDIPDSTVDESENLIRFNSISNLENSNDIYSNIDFIGTDIDSGFRVSKFAEKNKIIICAKLACCLYKLYKNRDPMENSLKNCIEKHLRIVSYEKLKGIWDGRYYPIVWYHDSWDNPANLLHYDDRWNSPIIQSNYDKIVDKRLDEVEVLIKVFTDLNKIEEIEYLLNKISKLQLEDSNMDKYRKLECNSKVKSKPILPVNEVHCALICINEKNEVLAFQRSNKRKLLPGKWEFGCGKLHISETWEECLIRSYKNEFNIDIDNESIIPLSTYSINKSGINTPGMIFTKKVTSKDIVKNIQISDRYEGYKWVDIDNMDLEKDDCVDDFKANSIKAQYLLDIFDFEQLKSQIAQTSQ
ncbi:NUDIX domain-containing protein [Paraclostridium bifermentans]|uniref:NUDIX domain-containing protein n=1 Tax=Paraclostridium bifermentans TaxID=1490 RepID=UPI001C822935|nr:NUDIX domain-containing protein [Paraclostridium bifermentans]GIM31528.1 hypothetical protein PAGU1678_07980 [Paraclostridium bifermentans subsp. muricolitidis]